MVYLHLRVHLGLGKKCLLQIIKYDDTFSVSTNIFTHAIVSQEHYLSDHTFAYDIVFFPFIFKRIWNILNDINRILHKRSFHMEFIKRAFGGLDKFHNK